MIKSRPTSAEIDSKVTNIKSGMLPSLTRCIIVSKAYELIEYCCNHLTSHSFKNSLFNNSSSNIVHLFFSLSVNEEIGTIGDTYKLCREHTTLGLNLGAKESRVWYSTSRSYDIPIQRGS